MPDQLLLLEAYARLKGLKANLPATPPWIKDHYVREFHEILELLQQGSGFDLTRFKVPSEAQVAVAGRIEYDRAFLKAKIDALLTLFELQSSEPKPRIGFRPG